MTNAIDPSLFYSSVLTNEKQQPNNSLGKDAFLKILMTQLQHQDPLNPMEDKDFIAQMATFSSLEQLMLVSQSIEKLISMEKEDQYIRYSQFVGKEVTWHMVEYPKNPNDQLIIKEGNGRIVSILYKENQPIFILEDGTELKPENISGINDIGNQYSLVEASFLIGKKVTWLDENGNEQIAIVQSVSMKDGQIYYHLNDEKNTKIIVKQIVKIETP